MTVERDIAVSRNQFSITDLSYPSNPMVHNIVFVFKGYSYNGTRGMTQPVSTTRGSIVLPLPSNLQDTYTVKVGEQELGSSGAFAADVIGSGTSSLKGMIQDLNVNTADIGGFLSTLKTAGAFVGRNAFDSLPVGGLNEAIDIGTGIAVNPHVALTFDGVGLKSHSFNWSLSPKNEDEARRIRDIITEIKRRMAPSYTNMRRGSSGTVASRALLDYPDLVEVYFVGVNQSYFYYFKPAMINTFTANYAPQGVALNKGGRPAVIQLDMSLTEASIHTREDY